MHVRLLIFPLIVVLLFTQVAVAQGPTVTTSELDQAVKAAAQNRQKNLDDVRSFFSSKVAQAALKKGKIDYKKVEQAVSTLSPEELAQLSAKTNQIQQDFAGGRPLTNEQLTYIIIALASAVIVLIIVKA
jgi:predicted flavoprotein YhiN